MNAKNAIIGLACVLAIAAAAQSAQAQFVTRAEREAMAQAIASFQNMKKNDKKAAKEQASKKEETPAPKANSDFRLPGREMRIVYSSDYMFDTACKIGQKCWLAVKEAARNAAKYGPGGREGAAMRSGEAIVNLLSKDNKEKPSLKEQLRENTDSLAKALEQADLKARQKAGKK